jgi:hypothetical protein
MLVLIACACQTNSGGGGDELSDAKATTHRFFDALGKGDCATLGELIPAASGSAACAKFIDEWREELKLALVDIKDVRRDGRDTRAIIVTTTVMRRGQQETLQLRMTHDGGVWHLAL